MAYTKKQKEAVEAAKLEKEKFLEENPHLKEKQDELDKKIKAAKKKKS
jgi:hypothetical protein